MSDILVDQKWMQHALNLAKRAEELGEVPVGAVLVFDDKLLAEGFNQPIQLKDPTAHAEILALRAGAEILNNYRLLDTTLYVTLEPCTMCMGAILHARVKRLVFGASDSRDDEAKLNHRLICESGILGEESSTLLKNFFLSRR